MNGDNCTYNPGTNLYNSAGLSFTLFCMQLTAENISISCLWWFIFSFWSFDRQPTPLITGIIKEIIDCYEVLQFEVWRVQEIVIIFRIISVLKYSHFEINKFKPPLLDYLGGILECVL